MSDANSGPAGHPLAQHTPTAVVVGAVVAVFAMLLAVLAYAALSARHHTEPDALRRAAEKALAREASP